MDHRTMRFWLVVAVTLTVVLLAIIAVVGLAAWMVSD